MIKELNEGGVRFVLDIVPDSKDFFLKAFREDRHDGAIYQRYRPAAATAQEALVEGEAAFDQFVADYQSGKFDKLWPSIV